MKRLVDLSVTEFIHELAAQSATPGGGSAAALAGSMAAALAGMAAGLSAKKKGLEALAPTMERIAGEARELARELCELVDADARAFEAVVAASRLPKTTDEEKLARRQALRLATLHAAQVPKDTLRLCLAASRLLPVLARDGNPNCHSDVAAGALLAQAGAEAAFRNVAINLDSLPENDPEGPALRSEAQALLSETKRQADDVMVILGGD